MAKNRFHYIPPAARKLGITLIGGKGSGKSQIAGGQIGYDDFFNKKIPGVIICPVGATIDAYLDRLAKEINWLAAQGQITKAQAKKVWSRVIYCDMSGRNGYITRFPPLYRYPDESYSDVAQRFVSLMEMLQPSLETAPRSGSSALSEIAIYTIPVLMGLGHGITEAREFLTLPKNTFKDRWKPRLQQLQDNTTDSEIHQACDFFLNSYYADKDADRMSKYDRERMTGAFLAKLTALFFDETSRSIHSGSTQDIDWQEVVEKRQVILLDFRFETNPLKRKFKMLLVYVSFRDFLIRRQLREEVPVFLIIDELSELYGTSGQDNTPFGSQIVSLLDQYSRQHNCWVTTLCQHIGQVDERSLESLLSCGTVAIGQVANYEHAERMAQNFWAIDPHLVKRWNYTWMQVGGTVQHMIGDRMRYTPAPRYERVPVNPVEYTPEEQISMLSWNVKTLRAFQLMTKFPGVREGDLHGYVGLADFNKLNKIYGWVDQELVEITRTRLLKQRETIEQIEVARDSQMERVLPPTVEQEVVETAGDDGAVVSDELEPATAPDGQEAAEDKLMNDKALAALKAFNTALEEVKQLPAETFSLLRSSDDERDNQ